MLPAVLWEEKTVRGVLEKRGLKEGDAGDVVSAVISELGMPRVLTDVDSLAYTCLKDPWFENESYQFEEEKTGCWRSWMWLYDVAILERQCEAYSWSGWNRND
jgi:hypothetical protein